MALTAAQSRSLEKMPKSARATAIANYNRQNSRKNGKGNGNSASRTSAPRVLAQGVGAIPRKAFGSVPRGGMNLQCWDATMPHHLSLPRPVGPYTVVRTTRRFSAADLGTTASPLTGSCFVFGTFRLPIGASGDSAGRWSDVCCIASNNADQNIDSTDNAKAFTTPLNISAVTGGSAATCVPSAFTVQIMNPEALQTSSGMVYAGVMNTSARIGGRSEKWDTYFERFVAYQAPRMCAAGKLALRGVKANSYPLSMSQLAEFTPQQGDISDTTFTWTKGGVGSYDPEGFAPILVYNPEKVKLEFLVTTEWRVRFDLSNPAAAGHRQHPIHSDNTWNDLMNRASSLGNGVLDIADTVSNAGQFALSLSERMGRVSL